MPRLDRVVAFGEGFLAVSSASNRITLWASPNGEAWTEVPGLPQPPILPDWDPAMQALSDVDLAVAGNRVAIIGRSKAGTPEGGAFSIVGYPATPQVAPETPPDALIAYVGGAEGAHAVKTIRSDGSDEKTLAAGESPAWSPDGRSIAYVCRVAEAAARGSLPDTCVMGADGSNQRVVATGAITPSGPPMARSFSSSRSPIDMGDTWIADADGSNARKVGDGKGSWSPDGAWILLVGASGATADATIVRPGGTGARKLGDCWEAAWSPDGTRLACSGWNEVERRGVLRVISIVDTSLYLFEEDATISRPTWVSANQVAFTMSTVGSAPSTGEQYLQLLVLRAGWPRRLLRRLARVGSDLGVVRRHLACDDRGNRRDERRLPRLAVGAVRQLTTDGLKG